MYGCHCKVNVLKIVNVIQMHIEMLVRINTAQPLKAEWPNCSRNEQILLIANTIVWRQELL